MNTLFKQLERLYFLPDQQWLDDGAGGPLTPEIVERTLAGELAVNFPLLGAGGGVRTLQVIFKKPADWPEVARLYQSVQEELELPAPAISVSGRHGFRLWFSLAEAVPCESAHAFLDGLRRWYLADIAPVQLQCLPDPALPALARLTPALHPATGKWSAFIDPGLGAMFAEESGLEMAPGMERQAQILAGLVSISRTEFEQALARLAEQPAEAEAAPHPAPADSRLNVGSTFRDPHRFLLAVMNDPSASPALRVEAAKALLPYFPGDLPQ